MRSAWVRARPCLTTRATTEKRKVETQTLTSLEVVAIDNSVSFGDWDEAQGFPHPKHVLYHWALTVLLVQILKQDQGGRNKLLGTH